jgi:glutamyl-tRNA reductase
MASAIDAAGRARRQTAIGTGAVSFGFSVVDLARNIFQRLEQCSVLILGAGETSTQVARSFYESGAGRLLVANRGQKRAEALQKVVPGVEILPFEARRRILGEVDIVVASTAAEEAILTRKDLEPALGTRRGRPLLIADLGLPRNVDPEVGGLENVFLQDIDALEGLIAQNLRRRREEVPRVQEILEHEFERFELWCQGRAAAPLVRQLQKRAEDIRRSTLDASRKRFPEETHEHLEQLTRALVRKLLHHPSQQLRRGDLSDEHLEATRRLFQLDHDES